LDNAFQVTVVLPSTLVALTMACGLPDRVTVLAQLSAAGPVAGVVLTLVPEYGVCPALVGWR
jgi:hypothetical protein